MSKHTAFGTVFPGDVVVDIRSLHAKAPFGIVSPGETGYQPLFVDPESTSLDKLDEALIKNGRSSRKPSDAERKAALVGSMFGWNVPGADPRTYEV